MQESIEMSVGTIRHLAAALQNDHFGGNVIISDDDYTKYDGLKGRVAMRHIGDTSKPKPVTETVTAKQAAHPSYPFKPGELLDRRFIFETYGVDILTLCQPGEQLTATAVNAAIEQRQAIQNHNRRVAEQAVMAKALSCQKEVQDDRLLSADALQNLESLIATYGHKDNVKQYLAAPATGFVLPRDCKFQDQLIEKGSGFIIGGVNEKTGKPIWLQIPAEVFEKTFTPVSEVLGSVLEFLG